MTRSALFRDIHNPTLAETFLPIVSNPVKVQMADALRFGESIFVVMADVDPFDDIISWVFATEEEANAFADYLEAQSYIPTVREVVIGRYADVAESIATMEGV